MTLAGPVPWKGNGKPGCRRGLRYHCKLSIVEEVTTLRKALLLWKGKREGHKVDGGILF